MSERKVLSKYYPPDFDPSQLTRQRGPKVTGPKLQPVRLMAPFSMKCTRCGEYIYKGRKFNARKETTEDKYYAIPIFRFYIKCTRCSGEITFKTDPKHMDYMCEKGAKRNFEPWRESKLSEETEEERLDRLEREDAERDAMAELETKVLDSKTEMAIADALDEIRTRNARLERTTNDGEVTVARETLDDKRKQQEDEDSDYARKAFSKYQDLLDRMEVEVEDITEASANEPNENGASLHADSGVVASASSTSANWQPTTKKKSKTNHAAVLGIKKSQDPKPLPKPIGVPQKQVPLLKQALLAGYDDDDDD